MLFIKKNLYLCPPQKLDGVCTFLQKQLIINKL